MRTQYFDSEERWEIAINSLGLRLLEEGAGIVVSSRRAEAAIESSHASIKQWSIKETEFGAENPHIRKRPFNTTPVSEQVLYDEKLPERLNDELNAMLNIYNNSNTVEEHIRLARVLEQSLGLVIAPVSPYPLDFDSLDEPWTVRYEIKNMNEVIEQLRQELFGPRSSHLVRPDTSKVPSILSSKATSS